MLRAPFTPAARAQGSAARFTVPSGKATRKS